MATVFGCLQLMLALRIALRGELEVVQSLVLQRAVHTDSLAEVVTHAGSVVGASSNDSRQIVGHCVLVLNGIEDRLGGAVVLVEDVGNSSVVGLHVTEALYSLCILALVGEQGTHSLAIFSAITSLAKISLGSLPIAIVHSNKAHIEVGLWVVGVLVEDALPNVLSISILALGVVEVSQVVGSTKVLAELVLGVLVADVLD